MDEINKEKKDGLDWEYIGMGLKEKEALMGEHITPQAGLFGQMFSMFAKVIIDELGKERGGEVIKKAVVLFAEERGRRIAEKVKALGKPLSFKNFLVYTDYNSKDTHEYVPSLTDGNLTLEIKRCELYKYADNWGMKDFFRHYCLYNDEAVLRGYNPGIKFEIPKNLSSGDEICLFKYIVKEK